MKTVNATGLPLRLYCVMVKVSEGGGGDPLLYMAATLGSILIAFSVKIMGLDKELAQLGPLTQNTVCSMTYLGRCELC